VDVEIEINDSDLLNLINEKLAISNCCFSSIFEDPIDFSIETTIAKDI